MPEADGFETQEIQLQGFDMVHAEGKAHRGQRGEVLFAFDAGLQHRILAEFENDLTGQVTVGLHIINELREEFLVGQGLARDVAEDADAARGSKTSKITTQPGLPGASVTRPALTAAPSLPKYWSLPLALRECECCVL